MPIFIANIGLIELPKWFLFEVSPGHSLRPLRAALPYLVAGGYFILQHIKIELKFRYIFYGIMTGVILLWSNDFAVPTAILFSALIIASNLYKKELILRNFVIYTLTSFFSFGLFLSLITDGHPFELLSYNFIDIPNDQWWYFGPYDGEASRILNPSQITLLFQETQFALLILCILSSVWLRAKSLEAGLLWWIGLTLFAGGLLPSIFGHVGGYFDGLLFWAIMVFLVFMSRFIWLGSCKLYKSEIKFVPCTNLILIVFLISSLLIIFKSTARYLDNIEIAKNDLSKFYVTELGGFLGIEWKGYIKLARQNNQETITEEYWGLWSATLKTFPNWPVDSVIHALGTIRDSAAHTMGEQSLIITSRYDVIPAWASWNVSQNYWFYQDLLQNWSPIYQSPLTTVWKRGIKNPPP